MNDKLMSLLGLCRRAGQLTLGFDKTAEAAKKGRVAAVLVAADTAARTEKELRFLAKERFPVVRLTHTSAQLSQAIGASAKAVGITHTDFANQALLLTQNGGM